MKQVKRLLEAIFVILVIFLSDITIRFFVEYFEIISVTPSVYYSSASDPLLGYFSSLGMAIVMSGWIYCLYYLFYTLVSPKLEKLQFPIKWLCSYLYYLIFLSISEFLFEGYRMDVLLVLLIAAGPISLLTTKLIPFRRVKKTV
ncbi:MAG: hypothetical protein ACJAVN_001182 [Roseivirga sp.]|jgi:hypothetical protein